MELEKKYIYQVYQCGSFSKAAEALFITQPALSIAIKKVEQEIGAAIFNRSQRPLTLTSIGELYLQHIKIMTTRQTGGLTTGYKPLILASASRRWLSLCSSHIALFSFAAPVRGVLNTSYP